MATSARVDDHSNHHAAHCFSDQYLPQLAIGVGTVSAVEHVSLQAYTDERLAINPFLATMQ